MATVLYIDPDSTNGPTTATSLGCGWMRSVPPQYASQATAPCVIVSGAGTTTVVPAPTSAQAVSSALAPILSAEQAASAAQATLAANASTITGNIQTHLGQIETWLAANPNGAILTAAQTAQLARMLVGVGRILLNLTSTVGQAT